MPMNLAGMRCSNGQRCSSSTIQGTAIGFVAPRTPLITVFCTAT